MHTTYLLHSSGINILNFWIYNYFLMHIRFRSAILKSDCYHREGHASPCSYGPTLFMLLFGAVQILCSQIPDFHNMELLSVLAAIMSFCYSFIGFSLGLAKVIGE